MRERQRAAVGGYGSGTGEIIMILGNFIDDYIRNAITNEPVTSLAEVVGLFALLFVSARKWINKIPSFSIQFTHEMPPMISVGNGYTMFPSIHLIQKKGYVPLTVRSIRVILSNGVEIERGNLSHTTVLREPIVIW